MTPPPKGHGYIDHVDGEEHFWRIETLWAAVADLEVEEVPLDSIPWRVDDALIFSDPPLWGELGDHVKRTMGVDLSYPIILDKRRAVMDGMHRIMRAFVEGRETIRAVTLDPPPPPDRVRPLPDATSP